MFKTDESRQAAWLTLGVWVLSGFLASSIGVLIGVRLTTLLIYTVIAINVLGILSSIALYRVAVWVREMHPVARTLLMAGVVVLAAVTLASADVLIMELSHTAESWSPNRTRFMRFAANSVGFFWILGMLGAIYLTLQANWMVRERERQLADARTAASEANAAASAARLAALRYQLNPHFLFNTLNAVSAAVITGRSDEAETMLSKLADFLRVTLVADPQALIPLEDELATLQAYLEIESVRFRDRLAVEFICPDDLRNAQTPSFLLQPLIENAIKHGVSSTSETVTIRLEASQDGEDLVLKVQDDGGGGQSDEVRPGAGVGLVNIRMRLETLYGERGSLQAVPLARGYLAVVRLPLQWNATVTPFRRRVAA
ncbi:sensor histidine kinase [Phenylobacterium sp.]|uniref:sensor histidine kinase n=1 Tax=Phenylobacterium sp. TaxID=1871053 RepID=UPI0035B44413